MKPIRVVAILAVAAVVSMMLLSTARTVESADHRFPGASSTKPGQQIALQSASCINGTFTGWTGDSIFDLCNGEVWVQAGYGYTYHYAYRPDVWVYWVEGHGYWLVVEGIDDAIPVVPATTVIRTCIEGEFTGWQGQSVFPLCNGQVWMQSSYQYHYTYRYQPRVLIYGTQGTGGTIYRMQVDGVSRVIPVVRIR